MIDGSGGDQFITGFIMSLWAFMCAFEALQKDKIEIRLEMPAFTVL